LDGVEAQEIGAVTPGDPLGSAPTQPTEDFVGEVKRIVFQVQVFRDPIEINPQCDPELEGPFFEEDSMPVVLIQIWNGPRGFPGAELVRDVELPTDPCGRVDYSTDVEIPQGICKTYFYLSATWREKYFGSIPALICPEGGDQNNYPVEIQILPREAEPVPLELIGHGSSKILGD